jgi:hypothetical protein
MNIPTNLKTDDLHWSEDGYAAISGDLFAWATALDREFLRWAEDFGATDHRFPTMIAAKNLAPISYLKSFPHLATFAVAADRNPAALKKLASDPAGNMSGEVMEEIEQLLTPAACYHFYPRLAGQRLSAAKFMTTRCQCHRREEIYLPLQRQWCFEMREFVCLGSEENISGFIKDCEQSVDDLAQRLGIKCSWQLATDPFFDPQGDSKALAQILAPTKRELCLEDGLAIGSINQHRNFFGECYDILLNDRPVDSACVAFGIERWLFAMLSAHGSNISQWPEPGVAP